MSTKGTLELIVFHSCPQVTSLLRLLSARRPALLNKAPLFRNKASLFGNKLPLLRDKRALLIPNKKEANPMIYTPFIMSYKLQHPQTHPSTQSLENLKKGGNLKVCVTVLHARDVAFFRANLLGKLFLSETHLEPFLFQPFSQDKGITFGIELHPLRSSLCPKVLSNQIFDWREIHFFHFFLCHIFTLSFLQNIHS